MGRRLAGGIVLLGWIAFVLAFNLAAAHYRDALAGPMPHRALEMVIPNLLGESLGLDDFRSWVLFGLGVLWSIFALMDGLSWDDRYPGYGAMERKRVDAAKTYAETTAELLDELEKTKDAATARLRELRQDLAKRRAEYFDILEQRGNLRSAFLLHLDYLESAGNELLKTYRDANRQARKEPPPAHFATDWRMPRPAVPELRAPSLDEGQIQRAVDRASAALDGAIERIFSAYEQAIERYERIEQLTLEELKDGGEKAA